MSKIITGILAGLMGFASMAMLNRLAYRAGRKTGFLKGVACERAYPEKV